MDGAFFSDIFGAVGFDWTSFQLTAVMRATLRFMLSLLICVAFLTQTGIVWSAPSACRAHATTASTAMLTKCLQSNTNQHAPIGKLCKAAAACSLTVPVFSAASDVPVFPYQRFSYPHIAAHFILQDFPQTLLRPPRLI